MPCLTLSVTSLPIDTCQGDSGGPLMMFGPNKQWILVGLTSSGIGCARPQYSGIYTRVAAFQDWIKSYTSSAIWIGNKLTIINDTASTVSSFLASQPTSMTPAISGTPRTNQPTRVTGSTSTTQPSTTTTTTIGTTTPGVGVLTTAVSWSKAPATSLAIPVHYLLLFTLLNWLAAAHL